MDFVITALSPAFEDITVGVDEQWWITAELRDDNGDPIADPHTGQPVTVTGSWWTSGAWNYFPPQAYNPDTGHRHPQWEDPPGSGVMVGGARMATYTEVEPFLRDATTGAVRTWQEQQPV